MIPTSFEKGLPLDFRGEVRLFPLPSYVFFPNVVKGLHIFEPRYCAMLKEALSSDNLIAMALLMPNWEKDYLNQPAIHPTVCIGGIVHHAPAPDGRHNILLQGLRRATIVSESLSPNGFRVAQVEPLADPSPDILATLERYRVRLTAALRKSFSPNQTVTKWLDSLIDSLNVDQMSNILCHELDLPVDRKQSLLAEPCVERRIEQSLRFADALGTLDMLSKRSPSSERSAPSDHSKNLLN